MVVPITRNGQVVAVMGVGNKDSEYTDLDLDVLTQFADFIWEINERSIAELRFKGLFNTTADGVMIIDGQTNICEVNDRYCEMSGYAQDEIVGMKIEDVEAKMSADEIQARLQSLLQTGSARMESRHRRKDGTLFDVDISVTLLQLEPLSVVSFLRDITDQKESERVLRDNQARFEGLSDASFESIFFSDKGKCIDQNLAAERMFGYTREEAIGRMGTEWIAPDDRDTVMNNMMSNTEEPYEVMALRKDGSTFPCEIQARTTTYQDRTVRITALRDISPRRVAEQARRESEEKLRSVIEQSNDAIYIYWNGRIDLINERFCEMTGVSADEAMATSFELFSMVDTNGNPDLESIVHGPRSLTAEPENHEFVLVQPDGTQTHVTASVKGIQYQNDEALLIVLRDITIQKELEEQFRQSQKMESIGLLAGGIAHDFNNLLSPIIGNAELALLNLSTEDEHYQEFIDIYSAAGKAKELVRQLLAFSRKQTLDFAALDINTLITNLEKILRRTIREDIDIEFTFVHDSPCIRADASQMEQVLLNLCINAQDAMPAGGMINILTEIVHLSEEDTLGCPGLIPGKHVQLSVIDTGHGMDSDTINRVFDPFFTTKEVGKGTGLGLSTVHGIVEQHRGYIAVDSQVGSGTTFSIYFPFSCDESETIVEQPASPTKQFEGKSVLLVEDQQDVRKVVRRILTELGLDVVSTGDPLEIIKRVEDGELNPDLLFTDVIMPKMNGRQLYEKLSLFKPGLRVIFVSGYSQDVINEKGVDTREMTALQKPFTMKSISDALSRVFSEW
jgi:two-component system, cell cycle sensor histidine kinase and response regulator CckA